VAIRKKLAKKKRAKKSTKRKAATKRRAGAKRKAAARRVSFQPRYRQVLVDYTSYAKKQKIEPNSYFEIKFKIDSGNMGKDSKSLGQIIDYVDKVCVPLEISYKYKVESGCLLVALLLFVALPISLSVASSAIYDILKNINSKKNTKTVYLSDFLKMQLIKASLMDKGEVGYFIESGEKTNVGTKYLVHLKSGERTVIITEQGNIEWI